MPQLHMYNWSLCQLVETGNELHVKSNEQKWIEMVKLEKWEPFGNEFSFLQNENENENGEMKSFGNECGFLQNEKEKEKDLEMNLCFLN